MPRRLRVMHEQADWPVEIAGPRVTIDGATFTIGEADETGRRVVTGPDGRRTGVVAQAGEVIWVSIGGHVLDFRAGHAGASRATGAVDAAEFMAPMPATVTRIAVAVGDTVEAGDLLIALEAMKMELPIRAPHAFTIAAIHCEVGEIVQPGTALVE